MRHDAIGDREHRLRKKADQSRGLAGTLGEPRLTRELGRSFFAHTLKRAATHLREPRAAVNVDAADADAGAGAAAAAAAAAVRLPPPNTITTNHHLHHHHHHYHLVIDDDTSCWDVETPNGWESMPPGRGARGRRNDPSSETIRGLRLARRRIRRGSG